MLSNKKLYETTEYWVEEWQNEIYRQVEDYMRKNDLNRIQLAEELGVSRGYVTQILKGDCNFSIKKLIELSLKIKRAPVVQYIPVESYYEIHQINTYINSQIEKTFALPSNTGATSLKMTYESEKKNIYEFKPKMHTPVTLTVVKEECDNAA